MKKRLFTILSVLFIDMFALIMVYPIFSPLLLQSPLLGPLPLSSKLFLLSLLIAAFPAAQLFGAPLAGYFADKTNRKKAFYLTLIGEIFGLLFSSYAIHHKSYHLLLYARLITGFFAGNLTVCLAAISDISANPEVRSKNFGLVASTTAIAFIIAIFVGGFFSNKVINSTFQAEVPFYMAAFLSLLNLLFVHLWYRPMQVTHVTEQGLLCGNVKRLYICFLAFMLAYIPFLQFLSAYSIEHFDATKTENTIAFLVVGFTWFIASFFLNRLLVRRMKLTSLMRFSLLCFTLSLMALQLLHDELSLLILAPVIAGFAALIWTNNLALISSLSPPTIQGKILGINQSMTNLSMMIAPLLASTLAALGTSVIYLAATLFACIALLFSLLIVRHAN